MKLLVLVGPTAVGKTRYSLEIAETFQCEILSGDSMQVYRGMDIGTAKATPEERKRIPHHMIDIVDPDEPFSVSEFQRMARAKIAEIHERGKLPFLVGGTGLYVEAVCYDFSFGGTGENRAFREAMKQKALAEGTAALHRQLAEVDPESAKRIHPNDLRRIIRALEVYEQTGVPLSQTFRKGEKKSPYELCVIGLHMEREKLYRRIEERVDRMIEAGLVQEVERLLAQGVPEDAISMQGLGYKEIIPYLRGEQTLEEAVAILKRNTRRFAKRQWSWFRRMPDIIWIDVGNEDHFSAHCERINDIISARLNIRAQK